MKSNKDKKLSLISCFKYWMLIPIVLLVVAIIFGCVFGLNLDYDFRTVSTFDVKFNTTVNDKEYKSLEKQLKYIISDNFSDYRIERIGEGAQNGLLVKIANDDTKFDTQIENLKTAIEDNLLAKCGDSVTSPVTITTTDTSVILPKNISEVFWYSVLAVACIMLFILIYYAIRYNFTASMSFVLTILFEIAMLTIVMIVARVPFNYYFVLSYFVMIFSTMFISTYINNYIRARLGNDKYSKYSNSDRVYDAFQGTFKPIIMLIALLGLSLFAIMFFGDLSLIYTVISILLGLVVTLFSIYFFEFSLWSFWYKKDKDATLRRRLELEKKRAVNPDGKQDEKIVV